MSELTWEERVISKLENIESMSNQLIDERNKLQALNAELLEALEAARKFLPDPTSGSPIAEAIRVAKFMDSVIAKARQ